MSRAPSVVVLDHGSGNVRSAVRALARAGAEVSLSADPARAQAAGGLVVPGVGAFASVMAAMGAVHGARVVERRLAGGRPVLGICVGMQVLFAEGAEHGVVTPGMGQWPGRVERLQAPIVPHMGWNTVDPAVGSRMFAGVGAERFYFVHSYACRHWGLSPSEQLAAPPVTWTSYGDGRFVSAVENGPLWATQFHPEKSGDAGATLLRNWLATL
ncbi:MAG: imidazole glycerol phosphate synthase subunit HisH [Nocardioidaceae bacterium]|nr:imidazole glycerol phosphate synthase subunit HisH [Nocardioidaceae bacterium]